MNWLKSLPPGVAGFLRGLGLAAALAVVDFLINTVSTAHLSATFQLWLPLVLLMLRTIEGILDGVTPATPTK